MKKALKHEQLEKKHLNSLLKRPNDKARTMFNKPKIETENVDQT